IDFDKERWNGIKDTYDRWWEGTLDRAVLPVVIQGRAPTRVQPPAPLLSQATSLSFEYTADALIDRIDYELSKNIYLGDAFPYFNMDCFGPGVLAAFLGAKPNNHSGRIWFFPDKQTTLDQMHFEYNPDNIWFKRVKAIYEAAVRRWGGEVVLGMVDLGGVLDVLATFRGSEHLLMDLYDEPDEVKRLVKEIHELWMKYYHELADILAPRAHGFSDWSQIFSSERSYVIQSDFSFMIGNDLFQEFVLDDLLQFTREIPNTIYHLDGIGQLRHLDTLLAMSKLKAIQWIPGAGELPQSQWPEVYRKIHIAGKRIQLMGEIETVNTVANQIGGYGGILNGTLTASLNHKEQIQEKLMQCTSKN
ncbi:MAG: hypothetical protein ACRCW2_15205, partial [Cellulosilyticaceae bacterium]